MSPSMDVSHLGNDLQPCYLKNLCYDLCFSIFVSLIYQTKEKIEYSWMHMILQTVFLLSIVLSDFWVISRKKQKSFRMKRFFNLCWNWSPSYSLRKIQWNHVWLQLPLYVFCATKLEFFETVFCELKNTTTIFIKNQTKPSSKRMRNFCRGKIAFVKCNRHLQGQLFRMAYPGSWEQQNQI